MLTGQQLRMGKIFQKDGKTFIVAMDHGLGGPQPGLMNPRETIVNLLKGKPDAILTNIGVIDRFASELSTLSAVLLTIPSDRAAIPYIKQAIKLGVDAVKVSYFGPFDRAKYSAWWDIAVECHEWGMPLMMEPVPMEKREQGMQIITDADMVAKVARMCAEMGADILKVAYTGSSASFRKVIEACPAPVTILGGGKMKTDRDVLEVVKGAVDAGSAGITMGRNVWKRDNVVEMVQALRIIIHENATVDEAMEELNV